MVGVKSANIKADRISEMVRVIKANPYVTSTQLAKMFSVTSSTISIWKKKAGLNTGK
jgi:predicted HTH transcriptional regulator